MQRSKTDRIVRCVRCRLHSHDCMCDEIPRLQTRTRVLLVLHRFEDRKSTNTGRLAAACLANAEIVVRGAKAGRGLERTDWEFEPGAFAGYSPVLLFPDVDAVPIESFRDSERPVLLVVPDGTWRQAAKFRRRVAGLDGMPCATIPGATRSRYFLRKAIQPGQLATIEAIARALGVLEGSEVEEALDRTFATMVERSLRARGSVRRPATA